MKFIIRSLFFVMILEGLVGCESGLNPEGEYLIGTNLDSISAMSDSSSEQAVSLFDKYTGRIHSFDLNTMTMTQSFSVSDPKEDHYIIANHEDDYIVDLSASQLSIFSRFRPVIKNPIQFLGKPISSAFDKTTGFLIVYDDLFSVAILKLDSEGQVLKSWVGGPIISGDYSLLAGDITPSGDLILSRSDNSLAIVDLEASVDQQEWVFTVQASSRNNIKWLAPVGNDKILFQSNEALVLYDYINGVEVDVLSQSDLRLKQYSKAVDAHVIYQNSSGNYIMAFSDGTDLRTRQINNLGEDSFLQSSLDLNKNQISIVKAKYENQWVFNNSTYFINSVPTDRVINTFRFSDMLSLSTKELPDEAQLKQTSDFMFALFPSELGFAQKINLISDEQSELKLFNIPYIK